MPRLRWCENPGLDGQVALGHLVLIANPNCSVQWGPQIMRKVETSLAAMFLCAASVLPAQNSAPNTPPQVGDAPAVALPLATDLSGKLKHRDVRAALTKVADWQLYRAQANF